MSIQVEIKPSDQISQDLQQEIDQHDREAFSDSELNIAEWSSEDWRVLAWVGSRWVSTLVIIDRTIKVGDQPVRVGGVGGVMTLPEHRGQGYATAAMQQAVKFICREMEADFGHLICSNQLTHFYGALGWRIVDVPSVYHQSDGVHPFPDHIVTMVYRCGDTRWPQGKIDLNGTPW